MKYVYPAFFYEDADGYSVLFPDFPCGTCGDTLNEALDMSVDFLYTVITGLIEGGGEIAKPSDITEIKPEADGVEYKRVFSTLVSVDVEEYGKFLASKKKAIRKNVTIPEWLAEKADAFHLNYSSVLQEALKRELGVG